MELISVISFDVTLQVAVIPLAETVISALPACKEVTTADFPSSDGSILITASSDETHDKFSFISVTSTVSVCVSPT